MKTFIILGFLISICAFTAQAQDIEKCITHTKKATSGYEVYSGEELLGTHSDQHKASETADNALLAGKENVFHTYNERIEYNILRKCGRDVLVNNYGEAILSWTHPTARVSSRIKGGAEIPHGTTISAGTTIIHGSGTEWTPSENWTADYALSIDEIQGYQIFFSCNGGIETTVDVDRSESFTMDGLEKGESCNFSMITVDTGGIVSDRSNVVTKLIQ